MWWWWFHTNNQFSCSNWMSNNSALSDTICDQYRLPRVRAQSHKAVLTSDLLKPIPNPTTSDQLAINLEVSMIPHLPSSVIP